MTRNKKAHLFLRIPHEHSPNAFCGSPEGLEPEDFTLVPENERCPECEWARKDGESMSGMGVSKPPTDLLHILGEGGLPLCHSELGEFGRRVNVEKFLNLRHQCPHCLAKLKSLVQL